METPMATVTTRKKTTKELDPRVTDNAKAIGQAKRAAEGRKKNSIAGKRLS